MTACVLVLGGDWISTEIEGERKAICPLGPSNSRGKDKNSCWQRERKKNFL